MLEIPTEMMWMLPSSTIASFTKQCATIWAILMLNKVPQGRQIDMIDDEVGFVETTLTRRTTTKDWPRTCPW